MNAEDVIDSILDGISLDNVLEGVYSKKLPVSGDRSKLKATRTTPKRDATTVDTDTKVESATTHPSMHRMYRRPEAASRAGLINPPQHDYEISAKKHFGITNNPRAAGYILRDGNMLDFSGRKEGGDPNTRSYDHRNIDHADGIPSFDHSHTESMRNFMRHTNAIRLSHLDGQTNADFVAHPTPQQLRTLRRIIPPDVNHRLLGAAQRWAGGSYDDFEDHDGHGRDFHGWLAKVKNSLNKFGVTETLITSLPTATSDARPYFSREYNNMQGSTNESEVNEISKKSITKGVASVGVGAALVAGSPGTSSGFGGPDRVLPRSLAQNLDTSKEMKLSKSIRSLGKKSEFMIDLLKGSNPGGKWKFHVPAASAVKGFDKFVDRISKELKK